MLTYSYLGTCYDAGYGVTQSYGEAANWYRKAAEQGDAQAQYNLGLCYYLGDGLPHLQSEGEAWLKKAAEQGYQPAIQALINISAEH